MNKSHILTISILVFVFAISSFFFSKWILNCCEKNVEIEHKHKEVTKERSSLPAKFDSSVSIAVEEESTSFQEVLPSRQDGKFIKETDIKEGGASDFSFLNASLQRMNQAIGLDESRLNYFQDVLIEGVKRVEKAEDEKFYLITNNPESGLNNDEVAILDARIEEELVNLENSILSILTPHEREAFRSEEAKAVSEYRKKSLQEMSEYMGSFLSNMTKAQEEEISTLIEEFSKTKSGSYRLGITLSRYGNSPESLSLSDDIEYFEEFKSRYKDILTNEQKETFGRSKYF